MLIAYVVWFIILWIHWSEIVILDLIHVMTRYKATIFRFKKIVLDILLVLKFCSIHFTLYINVCCKLSWNYFVKANNKQKITLVVCVSQMVTHKYESNGNKDGLSAPTYGLVIHVENTTDVSLLILEALKNFSTYKDGCGHFDLSFVKLFMNVFFQFTSNVALKHKTSQSIMFACFCKVKK